MKDCLIYIVDDHNMFSEGLKGIIESKPGLIVKKVFMKAEELLEAVEFELPDLVISDISMPKMNGIEMIKKIKAKSDKIKILVVSMHKDGPYVNEAMELGINGYIPKDSKADELFNAIDMIIGGDVYVSPRISSYILKNKSDHWEFTSRELEVLQHLAWGLNTQQIADKLFISPHTVETHRKNLLTKTGCKNTVDLCIISIEKGHIRGSKSNN